MTLMNCTHVSEPQVSVSRLGEVQKVASLTGPLRLSDRLLWVSIPELALEEHTCCTQRWQQSPFHSGSCVPAIVTFDASSHSVA